MSVIHSDQRKEVVIKKLVNAIASLELGEPSVTSVFPDFIICPQKDAQNVRSVSFLVMYVIQTLERVSVHLSLQGQHVRSASQTPGVFILSMVASLAIVINLAHMMENVILRVEFVSVEMVTKALNVKPVLVGTTDTQSARSVAVKSLAQRVSTALKDSVTVTIPGSARARKMWLDNSVINVKMEHLAWETTIQVDVQNVFVLAEVPNVLMLV